MRALFDANVNNPTTFPSFSTYGGGKKKITMKKSRKSLRRKSSRRKSSKKRS